MRKIKRREFIERSLCLTAAAGAPSLAFGSESVGQWSSMTDIDSYNYVVGTQTIGATYQFSNESLLVETARAILDMGSNILKFTMGRDYQRMMLNPSQFPETVQYLLNQGSDAVNKPRVVWPGASSKPPVVNPNIKSLTDLAQLEPAYKTVFRLPFTYYLIWTYSFSPAWWGSGFSSENQKKEYDEIYQFAAHLLSTYSGTGKVFYIGHWEGDWHLRSNFIEDERIEPIAIKGMIDWLNTRQQAIDDARRNTSHKNVKIFHYTTTNLVHDVAIDQKRQGVTNSVLPETDVDYVSYSSYDSQGNTPVNLPRALDYIESKLAPKPVIQGKRVFIGEYGFRVWTQTEQERARLALRVMRIGLEWGCLFVCYWQMYNNEILDGRVSGHWLIDDKRNKQPVWHAFNNYYQQAKQHLSEYKTKQGRLPTQEEFRPIAVNLLYD